MNSSDETKNRRPVETRKIPFFQNLAARLVKMGLTPNQVSVMSAVFAFLGGLSIYFSSEGEGACRYLYLLGGILGIQLRLICNLIDGLMAVEGGLKTKNGEIYNDFPDRLSDIFILIGIGYALGDTFSFAEELGWLASVLAVLTAYVRVLGVSMGTKAFFSGPMAKQHRMFIVTLALLATMAEVTRGDWGYSLIIALVVIALGSLITVIRRLIQVSSAAKNNA